MNGSRRCYMYIPGTSACSVLALYSKCLTHRAAHACTAQLRKYSALLSARRLAAWALPGIRVRWSAPRSALTHLEHHIAS